MEIGRGGRGQRWVWHAVVQGAILVSLANSWVDVLSMLVLCLALNYLGWRKVEISWALPAALLLSAGLIAVVYALNKPQAISVSA